MSPQSSTENSPEELSSPPNQMLDISTRSQQLIQDFFKRQSEKASNEPDAAFNPDPMNIGSAFMEMGSQMAKNPQQMVQANMNLWQEYVGLWQSTSKRMMGDTDETGIMPDHDDRRFKDEAWQENDVFNFMKQSYLLTSRWAQTTVQDVEGMDDESAKKVEFYTRQLMDAISPSNFAMSNPQVLRETIETKGENLISGLQNLLRDLEAGEGRLKIKRSDTEAFVLGENIATTPGKVVYRNKLMELLQFNPTTKNVKQTPLLVIPPWINKYYILDLSEKNSFIKWSTDQGHTVFIVSWVNPDADMADTTFEDYMKLGILEAVDAVTQATGEKEINAVGYCLAGTLLSSALAYMKAKGDTRIKSATFLTALVDFKDAGDLKIFVDESQLQDIEAKMEKRGFLDGSEMAGTFNLMRSNDMIWSFVINNYMMGKQPFPFDLLYWNNDTTRLPAAMHSFYLRNMYLENNLVKPGGITLDGVKIDLRTIDIPVYMISTKDDHIAPWKATYEATRIFSGPMRFVLSGSGHIAGVVNPPSANKYGYQTQAKQPAQYPENPEEWLGKTKQHEGSWWVDWDKWISTFGGESVPARKPGSGKLKAMEDAPGTYVNVKS